MIHSTSSSRSTSPTQNLRFLKTQNYTLNDINSNKLKKSRSNLSTTTSQLDPISNNKWIVFPNNIQRSSSKITRETLNIGVGHLFELLWEKSSQGCQGVFLPDTIVFHEHKNPVWYFTSVKTGKIMKKNSFNVTKENIFESFMKKRKRKHYIPGVDRGDKLIKKCDVVAYTIVEQSLLGGKKSIQTTFYDEEGLEKFLFNSKRKDIKNGFLQKFIPPPDDYNCMIVNCGINAV